MRSSVVPDLIDAMVAQFGALPALADVTVSDGYPLTNEQGSYLFVGVDDPESASRAASATATQEWPHATAHSRNEAGAVTLACESWNGDADQKAARDEVFRVAAEIQTALRASTTLGVPGVLWLSFTNLRLEQAQGAGGAGALLTFQIDFTARI